MQRQAPVAIEYERERFDEGFRADLIVEGKVIIELKSAEHAGVCSQPLRSGSVLGF